MKKLLDEISQYLVMREETLSVAESVTAGSLQTAFSLSENAMAFFHGGITAYNLGQKVRHLNVDPIAAETCNCVSEKISIDMANAVAKLFCSTWGIAITGYAAPVPEWQVKNKLFAFYAFSKQGSKVFSAKVELDKMDPEEVKEFYVQKIITDFLWIFKEHKSQHPYMYV